MVKEGSIHLEQDRLTGGSVDPYLYTQKNNDVKVYVAFHIDDNSIIGDFKTIDHVIIEDKKIGLVLKVKDSLTDNLSSKL